MLGDVWGFFIFFLFSFLPCARVTDMHFALQEEEQVRKKKREREIEIRRQREGFSFLGPSKFALLLLPLGHTGNVTCSDPVTFCTGRHSLSRLWSQIVTTFFSPSHFCLIRDWLPLVLLFFFLIWYFFIFLKGWDGSRRHPATTAVAFCPKQ